MTEKRKKYDIYDLILFFEMGIAWGFLIGILTLYFQ